MVKPETLYRHERKAHYAGHGNQYFTDEYTPVEAVVCARGKWLPSDTDCRGYTFQFECNMCRSKVSFPTMQCRCGYDFCPYCAAVMEG